MVVNFPLVGNLLIQGNITATGTVSGLNIVANVLTFGADQTGTRDSTTAINNAISAVSNGNYGTLFFPAGTYLVSNTITVPTQTALVGAGKRSTFINATNTFPNNTPMLVMGSGSITFDVKITDMFISPNQANGSGSIGIYATQLQEGCALLRVGVGGSRDTGIHLLHCSHIYCEDVEVGSNSLSANYGMYIDSCDIILNRLSLTSQSPVGVFLTNTYIVGSGWNLESATDGVRVTSTEGVLSNVSNGSSGTNHVHITDSSGLVLIALQNPFYSVTIQDDYNGITITDGYVPFWTGQAIGYGKGFGGAVTQATSKSTAVTLNKICGQITMNGAALAANTSVSFTVNNTAVAAATDTIIINIASGATANSYFVGTGSVSANAFTVHLRNISAGSLSDAVVLNYTIINAVNS
jgi:hypothetical protein